MPFPIDIKYINETEAKLGVKFPAAFVNKMTKLNGGSVNSPTDSWELYPFFDTSDRKRLARTSNDIVRETMYSRKSDHFPSDGVAIGSNGCGDHLILLPQSDAPQFLSHEIYWWDHETGEVFQVADDFTDLLGDR